MSHCHFIYLHPEIKDSRWSFLHQFIHPYTQRTDDINMVICTDLNLHHHAFLTATLKDWSGGKAKSVHLKYNLVDAILEIQCRKNPLGFLDSETPLDEQMVTLDDE